MRRSLTIALNLVSALTLSAVLASSGYVAAARGEDRALPMRFELRTEGPGHCGFDCKVWIAASGAITVDTPRNFLQFLATASARGDDLDGATVVLDSDGGSVLGAIALGREIRKAKFSTSVGRIIDVGDTAAAKSGRAARTAAPGLFSPRADCESMCAFVLLGGLQRFVPAEARVMVHQIWLGDRREDPTAATYSAEDLVLVQRDIGRLATFTAEMGGSMGLIDLALRIPPWEPLHVMTRDEITRTGLVTDEVPATAETVSKAPTTIPASGRAMTNGARTVAVKEERRWSLTERDGAFALARRHPLTVEGEQIGSFDVTLTCGEAGRFDLTYRESRREGEGLSLPRSLASVRLRLGGGQAPLDIVSSERADHELRSVAVGEVSADALRRFATGNRSIVVETTSSEMVTVIRLGNTGAPQNFPQLAADCGKGNFKSLGDRAEAVTAPSPGGTAIVTPAAKTGGLAPAH